MGTITEDYVSFEVAKLLKEKGFNEPCYTCYLSKELSHYDYLSTNFELINDVISAPTLQMVMKWMREVHKIYIDISPTYSEGEKTIHFMWQIFDSNYDVIGDCEIFYDKYETTCEAAIKYCLENLI